MAQSITWEKYFHAFPVNRNYIWLNNCGTTPASDFVLQAMQDYLAEIAGNGILTKKYPYAMVKAEILDILAKLLHTTPSALALIHNTAEGINMISHGLRLTAGDEILLLADEYPSNVYPWEHWQTHGVKLIFVPLANTPASQLQAITNHLTTKTKVLAISAVHWCTGMPLPLADLAALCRNEGIFLSVDGSQAAGHVPLDVDGWGIPALTFSCWKWLLGPIGMGCLVVPEPYLEQLQPVFKGTDSVVDCQQYLPYKQQWKPTADRYTYSTANFNDWIYFRASLKMLDQIGFPRVMQRLYELADYLATILRRAGFQVMADSFTADTDPPLRTAMLVVAKPGLDSAEAVCQLSKQGIVARERGGRIRFAPHIYNSFSQLEKVGEVLEAC